MKETTEVAVIGGGVTGCAIAYYLADAGVKTTIVEREGVGSQASGYSAGGLNPLQGPGLPGPLTPLALDSFRMHLEMWEQLKTESGVEFHPQMISMVRVAFEEPDLLELDETLSIFAAADGFSAHWLDGDDLRQLEPRIAHKAIRGLYTYGNAALNSHQYTIALSKAAGNRGAEIRLGAVRGLRKSNGRVTGVLLQDGEIACDSVVLAMGAWCGEAQQWLGVPIPVEPVKGEMLRMELPGPALAHDFTRGRASLYHRADGLVWVGTTDERRGFDRKPRQSTRRTLLKGVIELMPAMAEARLVMHTACLRPVTSDQLPIIGRAPGWENVYLAAGPGRKGILISLGLGKAIADLITHHSAFH